MGKSNEESENDDDPGGHDQYINGEVEIRTGGQS